jgi:hypothetical protein
MTLQRRLTQRRSVAGCITTQSVGTIKNIVALGVITQTLNVFELGKADKMALSALLTDSELVKIAATSASNVTVTVGAVLANLLGFAFE